MRRGGCPGLVSCPALGRKADADAALALMKEKYAGRQGLSNS